MLEKIYGAGTAITLGILEVQNFFDDIANATGIIDFIFGQFFSFDHFVMAWNATIWPFYWYGVFFG